MKSLPWTFRRASNVESAPVSRRSATLSSPISPRQLAPRGNPPETIGQLRPRTAATPEATAEPPPTTASGDVTNAASLQTDRTRGSSGSLETTTKRPDWLPARQRSELFKLRGPVEMGIDMPVGPTRPDKDSEKRDRRRPSP
jgi:hypothetical protein